jgi:hypothetical protein
MLAKLTNGISNPPVTLKILRRLTFPFEFDADRPLKHRMIHLRRSLKCYGCYQALSTYQAMMIIHLESGACESEIDIIDLTESAAMCFQWMACLDEEFRDDRHDLRSAYSDSVYLFNAANSSL